MALFHFGKKEEEKGKTPACSCRCGCSADQAEKIVKNGCSEEGITREKIQSIKVLGSGCKSCHEQYENAKQAAKELGLKVEVEYMPDMQNIMKYGVMRMPALVVNEKVISMGKVLKTADVVALLNQLKL